MSWLAYDNKEKKLSISKLSFSFPIEVFEMNGKTFWLTATDIISFYYSHFSHFCSHFSLEDTLTFCFYFFII
jgi:hypothetical protein